MNRFGGSVTATIKDGEADVKVQLTHATPHDVGHVLALILSAAAGAEIRNNPAQWALFQLEVAAGLSCGIRQHTVVSEQTGRAH